jgi:hypothetical protein
MDSIFDIAKMQIGASINNPFIQTALQFLRDGRTHGEPSIIYKASLASSLFLSSDPVFISIATAETTVTQLQITMGSLGLEAPLKAEASLKEKNRVLFETLPASLPVANFGQNVDHFGIASAAIAQLEQLEESAIDENIVWRDICALTGTFRTFYGAERVLSVWRQLGLVHKPFAFKLALGTSEIVNVGDKHSWIQTAYTFECRGQPETVCSGFMGLIPDSSNPSNWKIWMLTTLLEEIKGFPNPDRITVQPNNIESYPENVLSSGAHDKDFYQCVVVGAGFSGLCVAGRLKALGVQCLNLEKNPQVGDNWKNRYLSARCKIAKVTSFMSIMIHRLT